MNANDVIESYITDVAVQLPRKQRNDVAFELRELLNEELQARADASGRAVDVEMAIEFLRAFGRPADVAASYRPTLTIIDPADGHAFLRATVIGLAIIWCVGLFTQFREPVDAGLGFLSVLGQWWVSTVIPSLWWPGVLAVSFGMAAWTRRRWPQTSKWKPRAGDRIVGNRATLVMGIVGILCGLFVLLDPRWLLDVLFNGHAAPAAYEAFTYTDTFVQRQAPWLLALLLLNIPMWIAVIVKGRWSPMMRRMETGLSIVTCAVLVWTLLDGPVFKAAASDSTARFFLMLIVAFTLLDIAIKLHRRVRPAPNNPVSVSR